MSNQNYSSFFYLYTKQPKIMETTTHLMGLRAHWLMLLTLGRALEEMFTLMMMNFGQQIPEVLLQLAILTLHHISGTSVII